MGKAKSSLIEAELTDYHLEVTDDTHNDRDKKGGESWSDRISLN